MFIKRLYTGVFCRTCLGTTHWTNACPNSAKPVCDRCSTAGHTSIGCTRPIQCNSCGGRHYASSCDKLFTPAKPQPPAAVSSQRNIAIPLMPPTQPVCAIQEEFMAEQRQLNKQIMTMMTSMSEVIMVTKAQIEQQNTMMVEMQKTIKEIRADRDLWKHQAQAFEQKLSAANEQASKKHSRDETLVSPSAAPQPPPQKRTEQLTAVHSSSLHTFEAVSGYIKSKSSSDSAKTVHSARSFRSFASSTCRRWNCDAKSK